METTCKHNLTRKLYFQRANKWVTTEYSICEYCSKIIKKETKKIEVIL